MIIHLDDKMFNSESISTLQALLHKLVDQNSANDALELLANLIQELDDQNMMNSNPFEEDPKAMKELVNRVISDDREVEPKDKIRLAKKFAEDMDYPEINKYILDNEAVLDSLQYLPKLDAELKEFYAEQAKEETKDIPQWVQDSENEADFFGQKLCEQHEQRGV